MPRPTHRPGNLPAEATSFIGRHRELAEVRKKLTAARLVSLVGPHGVGKTRLAIRIATDLGRGFPGGAWLVQLAEVQDPALVSNAVTADLDLRDQTATVPGCPFHRSSCLHRTPQSRSPSCARTRPSCSSASGRRRSGHGC